VVVKNARSISCPPPHAFMACAEVQGRFQPENATSLRNACTAIHKHSAAVCMFGYFTASCGKTLLSAVFNANVLHPTGAPTSLQREGSVMKL
jgi:hypothetical protein